MSEHLEEAFYRYMERVVKDLETEKRKFSSTLTVYPGFEKTILDRILSQVESSDELKSLVKATDAVSPSEHYRSMGESAVKNFFRRSGVYSELRQGRVPEVGPVLLKYRAAVPRTTKRTTRMTPLDLLHMKGNAMCFQTFELRKFSAQELDAFLGQGVNRNYYQDAVLDLENLHHYWWLLCEEERLLPTKPGSQGGLDPRVKMHLTEHQEIEMPMKILALYNWLIRPIFVDYFGDGIPGMTWTPPAMPFVISVHDNLLQGPPAIDADLDQLLTAINYVPDSDETYDGPLDYWDFNEVQSAAFEDFLRRTESMVLGLAQVAEWRFVSVALDYLLKAFVSKGKEQLVWHIIALESLLGQRGEPLTDSIGQRLAAIMVPDEKAQKQIKNKFRQLYNFRCDVVHGNATGSDVLVDHLNEARYFARDTLVWFLHFLTDLRKHWTRDDPNRPLPTRKDLLCLLDMSPAARGGLSMFKAAMPDGFPNVAQWLA